MKTLSQLGIYMDHSKAIFLELKDDAILHHSISSDFTKADKEFALSKSEKLMHNKELHELTHFYKKISDTIRNFQVVLLFGPTEAKNELLNLLNKNHLFDQIKIEVKATDKMEQSEMDALVLAYFN